VTDGWPANGTPLRQLVTFPLTPVGERLIRAKGFVPLTAERME
jgi:hypothetical protein